MFLLSAATARYFLLTSLLATLPLVPLVAQTKSATKQAPTSTSEPVYDTYQTQIQPKFAAGQLALQQYMKSVQLPAEVRQGRVNGMVYVSFVVRPDGRLTDAFVSRGLSQATNAEALRLVQAMPSWRPGRRQDQAVAVRMTLAVVFQMPAEAAAKSETAKEPAGIKAYSYVEQLPVFPGGREAMLRYIQQQLRYPAQALREKVEGSVFVRFIIDSDGLAREVKVQKGLGAGCDEEAVRVIKSLPRFKPGMIEGRAVPVNYFEPVKFSLNPLGSSGLMNVPAPATAAPQPEPEKVYTYVEKMPVLSGTSPSAALQQALVLPPEVREGRTEGTVFLNFVVRPTGTVTDLKVVRGLCPACDEAALAAARALPPFEPGKQNGRTVAVQFTVPVQLYGPNHVFDGGQVATPATFPGGGPALRQYLTQELKEPKVLKREDLRGAVEVSFVVQADGRIGAAEIIRPLCRSCDEEALRLVRAMPRWAPARSAADQPVSVRQQVIIPMPAAELPPRRPLPRQRTD